MTRLAPPDRARRLLRGLGLLLLGALVSCQAAWAQGCPMCRESASTLGEDGQWALNVGIFMLLIPPVLIMATIIGGVWYYVRLDRLREEDRLPGAPLVPPAPPPSA